MLSAEQELALAAQYKANGCARARDAIIGSHLRLAASCARKFCTTDADRLDSLQDGALGLLKALDEFDVARGLRFSSLAAEWVRRAILAGIKRRNRGRNRQDDIDPDGLFDESEARELPADLQVVKRICSQLEPRLSREKRAVLRGRLLNDSPVIQRTLATRLGTTQPHVSLMERSILRAIRRQLGVQLDHHRRMRSRTKRSSCRTMAM